MHEKVLGNPARAYEMLFGALRNVGRARGHHWQQLFASRGRLFGSRESRKSHEEQALSLVLAIRHDNALDMYLCTYVKRKKNMYLCQ